MHTSISLYALHGCIWMYLEWCCLFIIVRLHIIDCFAVHVVACGYSSSAKSVHCLSSLRNLHFHTYLFLSLKMIKDGYEGVNS